MGGSSSRQFLQACLDYRLQQKFITPYTPKQYGVIELLSQSQRRVRLATHVLTFEEARRIILDCVQWYNEERPHQASTIAVRFNIGHNEFSEHFFCVY